MAATLITIGCVLSVCVCGGGGEQQGQAQQGQDRQPGATVYAIFQMGQLAVPGAHGLASAAGAKHSLLFGQRQQCPA
jgi:hypothetical protein